MCEVNLSSKITNKNDGRDKSNKKLLLTIM